MKKILVLIFFVCIVVCSFLFGFNSCYADTTLRSLSFEGSNVYAPVEFYFKWTSGTPAHISEYYCVLTSLSISFDLLEVSSGSCVQSLDITCQGFTSNSAFDGIPTFDRTPDARSRTGIYKTDTNSLATSFANDWYCLGESWTSNSNYSYSTPFLLLNPYNNEFSDVYGVLIGTYSTISSVPYESFDGANYTEYAYPAGIPYSNITIPISDIDNFFVVSYYFLNDLGYKRNLSFIFPTISPFQFTPRFYYFDDDFSPTASYASGFEDGVRYQSPISYRNGFDDAYDLYYDSRFELGQSQGYNSGYNAGSYAASNYSFSSLLNAVFDVPVTTLTSLFNYDILGFNLLGLVTGFFTCAVVLWFVKRIT